jgi:hypothetical protein
MKNCECSNCEKFFNVGKYPRIGQHIICKSCETRLEIYSLDPIELDWATSGNNKNRIRGASQVASKLVHHK